MAGVLYLVPNLLGVVPPQSVLPQHTIAIASRLEYFIVETAKPARQFLKALGTPTPLREIHVQEIGDQPTPQRCAELLAAVRTGHDVGVLSDAGCPGIADPGARVVAAAHHENVRVVPLVGPSAVLLALMASGMNGQGFAFHGYLPIKTAARVDAIRRLESESQRSGYAQLFIETPYRNTALLQTLVATLRRETRLCAAVDLTLPSESIVSQPVRDWSGHHFRRYDKRPAIFVVQT